MIKADLLLGQGQMTEVFFAHVFYTYEDKFDYVHWQVLMILAHSKHTVTYTAPS